MRQSERITKHLIELRQTRDRKRAKGLKNGTLAIVLDNNGIPIVIPVDQPILTYAEKFHRLAEDKT